MGGVLDLGQVKGPQGPQGPKGDTGPQGNTGPQGVQGANGITPNIQVGTVTTLAPGSDAYFTRQADSPDAAPVFDVGLPRGADSVNDGDMKAAMYDPQEKGEDIFAYTDAALEDAKEYTAQYGYSKEQSLSAETKAKYGLGETATPDQALSEPAKIGDVVQNLSSDMINKLGINYLPCCGQILNSSDYPAYADFQGPIVGLTWTSKSYTNYPNDFPYNIYEYAIQTKTERIFVIGIKESGGSSKEIFASDDNFRSFVQKKVIGNIDVRGFIYDEESGKILLICSDRVFKSLDDGETWTVTNITTDIKPSNNPKRLSDGRIVTTNGSYSDDDGITWVKSNGSPDGADIFVAKNGNIITTYSSSYASNKYRIDIYLSKDCGETFKEVFSGYSSNRSSGKIGQLGDNFIIVQREEKYIFSTDNGETWAENTCTSSYSSYFLLSGRSIILDTTVSFDVMQSNISISHGYFPFLLKNGEVVSFGNSSTGAYAFYSSPDTERIILPKIDGAYVRVK